ncbi:ribonuclease D [Longimicrobium sp.]|uniref:ribonuclease D n=1 Tax=Longimicrobium sp. TaxID=2029185 RepID=UPI002C652EF0|nr:ribonuclease D [Longimicrobium sp.]HSU15538.1 ribonuclease D [Longimicrobium sp.]
MEYEYIDTPGRLREVVDQLRNEPLLGADTEAAGYHRYFDRLSLVQLSSRERNYLVDPQAVTDLSPLGDLFADEGIEKIFHDADYDVRILDRDAGLAIANLFDTQVAAAFLGERQLGLGNIAEKYLGLKLPKEHQRADWGERPLTEGMKEYAATDTAHLPELRDRLRQELVTIGRLHWAEEEFRRREQTRWTEPDENARESWMKVKGARDLQPRGLAVLRELYEWREGVARELDRATFRVLGNQALIEMAMAPPRNFAALKGVTGLSDGLAQRRGRDILAAVSKAMEIADDELPRWPRSPRWERDVELEARVESLKNARNRRADELGLDPGFVMSRAQLEEVARARPRTTEELAAVTGVRRWQVEAVGDALLKGMR